MPVNVRVDYDPVALAALYPWQVATPMVEFFTSLERIAGTPVGLLLPVAGGKLTNVSFPDTRVWTQANTQIGRDVGLGRGTAVTYNGTSDLASATDSSFPSGAAARTFMALIRPTSVSVVDNPIFSYGTVVAKQAILWELNSARQRVGVYTAVSDLATTSQAVGRMACIGANFDGVDVFSFFNNGAADGTSAAIAAVNTVLAGAGAAVVGDATNPVAFGLANKGNVTTGFVGVWSGAKAASVHAAVTALAAEFYGGLA